MDPLSVFCLVIVTLALAWNATSSFLNSRTSRQREQEMQDLVGTVTKLSLDLTRENRDWIEKYATSARTQQGELFSQLSERHSRAATELGQLAMRTADLMQTRSIAGSEASLQRAMETIRSQGTMLASKDPIAFSQMSVPAPFATDATDEPYPAVDEVAERDLRQQMEAQALQAQLEGLMGGLQERGISVTEQA